MTRSRRTRPTTPPAELPALTTSLETSDDFLRVFTTSSITEFVAIDLETTGLDPDACEIIEIGAVRFAGGVEVDRFTTLVQPRIKWLPDEIVALTGITNGDLVGKPRIEKVARNLIDFVGASPILGQNVGFDLGFLAASPLLATSFSSSRTATRSHDVGSLARFLYPCLDSYGLASLATTFGSKTRPRHRAADDAAATGEVFVKLLEDLRHVSRVEIADAIRLLESTSSPLLNTLRIVLAEGLLEDAPPPPPFRNSPADRNNIYTSPAVEPRPTEAVDGELIQKLFRTKGRFADAMPAYELRSEQMQMAATVAEALTSNSFLAVEAGTGVGKSLGYLIPSLLSGKRVAISTFTRHLQDQLFHDEIPKLGKLFRFGFTAAMLKGRRNYLCKTRWRELLLDPTRYPADVRERAAWLVRWVNATTTGDISEVTAVRIDDDDLLSHYIASEPGYCTTKICTDHGECPLGRIRKAVQKADLVVVNHSLVLSDFLADGAILGGIDRMVFDEAHHLEAVATDQFGTDVSAVSMRSTFDRLGRLVQKGGELSLRLLAGHQLESARELAEFLAGKCKSLHPEVDEFFLNLKNLLADVRLDDNYPTPVRYDASGPTLPSLQAVGGTLLDSCFAVDRAGQKLLSEVDEDSDANLPAVQLQELKTASQEVAAICTALKQSLSGDDPNRVYWIEIPNRQNHPPRLKSAPLDVSTMLAEGLFSRLQAGVLTSATLTTGGNSGFGHLLHRTGLAKLPEERVGSAVFGSPFDYEHNALVVFPGYFPKPNTDPVAHNEAVAEFLSDVALAHRRSLLALFTSYATLRRVEKEVRRKLTGTDIDVLVQFGRSDRDRLIRRFRSSRGGLLLGTDSLWEGIDVPGAALEIVVITKLPFEVPGDPVVSARIDQLKLANRNPFNEYQLPAAILRTRQGAGRLIRTMTDRGVIAILDPRTVSSGYGSMVRRAIPGRQVITKSPEETQQQIADFFA